MKLRLPLQNWLSGYNRRTFGADTLAAVVVTLLLLPQGLAYAVLAGLPPQMGLYASILPMAIYALFGTSRTLSVGPVAVTAIMTASALNAVAEPGTSEYVQAALALTLLSGLMLLIMGYLRLGALSHLLSHPVITGFISAAAVLIAVSQMGPLTGLSSSGETLLQRLQSLYQSLGQFSIATAVVGLTLFLCLWFNRRYTSLFLTRTGVSRRVATLTSTLMPAVLLVATLLIVMLSPVSELGLATVGSLPEGLPSLILPDTDRTTWLALLPAAFLISLVGFVESISMARSLAARYRDRIQPDQELKALGAANIMSAGSGGMPVTGSFTRSAVNMEAGAQTPVASLLAALLTTLGVIFLGTYLQYLPLSALAALIIVAVLPLIDLKALLRLWQYAWQDALAMLATFVAVLAVGIETGLFVGIGLSIVLFIHQTSRPHIAVVGRVPGTDHFRNILRHKVETLPHVLQIRIDESLYFANAHHLEDRLEALVNAHPDTTDVLLQCNAINHIDGSALDSLETIHQRLQISGIRLHLSEVKGPVMDRLRETDFLRQLSGHIFLSHAEGVSSLSS